MASIREIKSRIKSVNETRQITKAMKLISAAKMRKARAQLEKALPYFKKVKSTMADILIHSENIKSPFLGSESREVKHKGYLILGGDKTLAGSYNHNIIKAAEEEIDHDPKAYLFVAGDVGKHHFIKYGYKVDETFDYPVQNPSVYRARDIADILLGKFKAGELDEVFIIYTLLETSISLKPVIMKLLPLELETLKLSLETAAKDIKPDESLVYEPTPEAVFDVLIPKYIKGIVYGALTEAFASEQSARMTAMDNATVNADEILHTLNLTYNRARQSAITQEISEIIGGAEALK